MGIQVVLYNIKQLQLEQFKKWTYIKYLFFYNKNKFYKNKVSDQYGLPRRLCLEPH